MPFRYQPSINPTPYGLHVPYTQGYDARSRRNGPAADDNPAQASGYFLRPNGAMVDLWISEVAADFSLTGQVGQSRMTRTFFPRSFNTVTLTITGNVASTQEYNRLALFIREHHYNALQYINDGGTANQTIVFGLYDRTPKSWANNATNVKGNHLPWIVNGYVKTVDAGAVALEVAPAFSIEFVVTTSTFVAGNTGLWQDTTLTEAALPSFIDLINVATKSDRASGSGFVTNPVAAATPAPQTDPPLSPNVLLNGEGSLWSVAAANTPRRGGLF